MLRRSGDAVGPGATSVKESASIQIPTILDTAAWDDPGHGVLNSSTETETLRVLLVGLLCEWVMYVAGGMRQESRCRVEGKWSSCETPFDSETMMPGRVGTGVGCVPRSPESGAGASGSRALTDID